MHEIHPSTPAGYVSLNSSTMGLEWVASDSAGDGLYEPVFRRQASLVKHQGVFASFPHLDVWPMGDLYSKHPTEPDVWKYEGRKDDTIILSNGENISPLALERELLFAVASAGVKRVLLVGNARPALGLLYQTSNCRHDVDVVDAVWQGVESCINSVVGPLAKIEKSRILRANAKKPFVTSKKGTTVRRATVEMYEGEIDALYCRA